MAPGTPPSCIWDPPSSGTLNNAGAGGPTTLEPCTHTAQEEFATFAAECLTQGTTHTIEHVLEALVTGRAARTGRVLLRLVDDTGCTVSLADAGPPSTPEQRTALAKTMAPFSEPQALAG